MIFCLRMNSYYYKMGSEEALYNYKNFVLDPLVR